MQSVTLRVRGSKSTPPQSPSGANKLQGQSSADGPRGSDSNAASFGEADRHALRKLWLFAIITLSGSILVAAFFAWYLLLLPTPLSSFLSGIFGAVQLSSTQSAHLYFDTILPEFVITNALMFVAVFPLRSALGDLSRTGISNFRTPRMMMLVMLICILMSLAGRFLDRMITSPVHHWMFFMIALFLGTGAYGTIIGGITGETLGIWRIGSRYKENLFKAASVLLVIPVVQIVSPIMIFIGLRRLSSNFNGIAHES